jgi:hypothetical protein
MAMQQEDRSSSAEVEGMRGGDVKQKLLMPITRLVKESFVYCNSMDFTFLGYRIVPTGRYVVYFPCFLKGVLL